MKKKNLKTYILIALIVSSVILTGKIWFDEKLWPEGYNFFAVITDIFSSDEGDYVSSLTKETISFPKTLVVTNADRRSVYTADSDGFSQMIPDIKELLRLALESSETATVTEQDWWLALKSRSIGVSYPVAYDSKLFLNILGSYHTDGSSIPVKEFLITAGATADKANIFIRNYHTSEITAVAVGWDRNRLNEMIDANAVDSIGNLSYSSELNFDKTEDTEGARQKVVIASNVLIQLNKRLTHVMRDVNPVYADEFNQELTDNVLKHFSYNTSGVRKYTERDNSMVFVENYSTLKIHPNGLVEYKAVDASKGIALNGGGNFYQALLGCVDFVNELWGHTVSDVPLNINISSDVIWEGSSSFRLTMDYHADGAQIHMDIPQSPSHDPMNHAVEIQVTDGKIVSYRQVLAYFESYDRADDGMSAINALDKLLAVSNMEGQTINDLYPVYISGGEHRTSAWAARTADNRTIIIN